MKKDLKKIMDLSFPFCKSNNEQLALYFQKINHFAHEAEVYLKKNGLNEENHWTDQHNKNYHRS